ncbi:hypothetical protein ACO0LM_16175 [Undibacterium sp. Di26W]|uniref:hypothetical protein n=1 Tax=Undibacterium sp. Di26W TaxID=3413035 RepID=UPI003BF2C811
MLVWHPDICGLALEGALMIVPTYFTLPEAVQFLSDKTAQPVTTGWLLQLASEEKLQIFFHPQRLVVTGNLNNVDSLKYYEPGQKYSLDKGWTTLMIDSHSIEVKTLPDASDNP